MLCEKTDDRECKLLGYRHGRRGRHARQTDCRRLVAPAGIQTRILARERTNPRCCGIDLNSQLMVACFNVSSAVVFSFDRPLCGEEISCEKDRVGLVGLPTTGARRRSVRRVGPRLRLCAEAKQIRGGMRPSALLEFRISNQQLCTL